MKLNYSQQTTLSFILVIIFNILSTLLKHWIYVSIGFAVCGLIYIINPVVPANIEPTKKALLWSRVAGVILILLGVFTRSHLY